LAGWGRAEAAVPGEGVEGAADGIASVEDGALAGDQFDAVERERIDESPVLVRAVAEGGIIVADAVDEGEVAEAGEAADERGSLAIGGFLDTDAGQFAEGFREGSDETFLELLGRQFADHGRGRGGGEW